MWQRLEHNQRQSHSNSGSGSCLGPVKRLHRQTCDRQLRSHRVLHQQMLRAMRVSRPDLPAEPASVQSHEESRNHSSALVRRPLRPSAYVDISVKRKAAQAEQGAENSALCTTLELYNTTTRSAISESKGPNSFNSSLLPYHSPFLFLILFHHFLAQHERPETTLAIL